jgi:hypothetical protein
LLPPPCGTRDEAVMAILASTLSGRRSQFETGGDQPP